MSKFTTEDILALQKQVMQNMQKSIQSLHDDLWGNPTEIQPPEGFPAIPTLEELESKPRSQSPVSTANAKPAEQVKPKEEQPKENIEDLKKELQEYIGLAVVKDEVQDLINLVTVQNMRKEHGLKVSDLSLHMVFSGNPGTGKTMIARLMARIYRSLGILSRGHLVEVDRSGLVAGFVGQTAIKTQDVLQKAMGGVLFIDEAYALSNKQGNDFGQEAIDTILKAMEDHRDNLIVIVAGYTELMQDFIQSNPGLQSRFNRFLEFADYTASELIDIFRMRCEKSAYVLAEDATNLLKEILEYEQKNNENFGNARGVRNLFEKTVVEQANRLAQSESITKEALMCIQKEDLALAADAYKKGILKGE
ncbi:MAG: AAA family ATPase [Eubacteriales bacterium]|nr:AAA family ATPase [Eubacteriales bacterium]